MNVVERHDQGNEEATPGFLPQQTQAAWHAVALALAALFVVGVAWYFRLRGSARAAAATNLLSPPASAHLQLDANVPLVALINVKSGGGMGALLIALLNRIPNWQDIYPLSSDGIAAAVRRVAQLRSRNLSPRLVCAGGDGTVTAIVRTLLEKGLASVPVVVMPLGTGNDCAHSLGMTLPALELKHVVEWLRRAQHGRVVQRDVFNLHFETYGEGSILCVRDRAETQLAERVIRGTTLMYTSVGTDSRCVYTVEMWRQRSRLLNKLIYFMAGTFNMLAGRPPVTSTLNSLFIDDARLPAAALGQPLHSLVCLLIPSFAGGTNLWRFAWTLPVALYRQWFGMSTAANIQAPVPESFMELPPPQPPTGSQAHLAPSAASSAALRSVRGALASWCVNAWRALVWSPGGWQSGGKDPWARQATDDGCFELIGVRSLFHLGGIIGTNIALWGGVYRLAQPRSIRLEFNDPHAQPSRATPMAVGQNGEVHRTAVDVPSSAANESGNGSGGSRGTFRSALTPSAAAAALRRVAGSAATRLRSRRAPSRAVLAPPETECDDEEGVEAFALDDHDGSGGVGEGEDGSGASAVPQPHSSSTSTSTKVHARGYALVPRGQITSGAGGDDRQGSSRGYSRDRTLGAGSALTPFAAGRSEGDMDAGGGVSHPASGDDRSQPLHTGHGRASASAGEPVITSLLPSPSSSTVIQGGTYADTEPVFVQVDGEGYKVYALRTLSLTFRARANMVCFS